LVGYVRDPLIALLRKHGAIVIGGVIEIACPD
jgi:hypothetical protein